MYRRRIPSSIVSLQHNLKTIFLVNNSLHYSYTFMIRQRFMDLRKLRDVSEKLHLLIKRVRIYNMLRNTFNEVPRSHCSNVLRVWAHQCECVVAQRFRRCQQMFCMYSSLWEERALKEFMLRMQHTVVRKGKDLMLGAIGISAYNWEVNRIPEDDMKRYIDELDYINTLKQNTICLACDKTIQQESENALCKCGAIGKLNVNKTYDNWAPFIEKTDLLVWRRMHPSGFYEYKVYGSYNDVSAEDFLNVQIDTDYRRTWDNTAVILEVAETDPTPNSNSDIIYWEMLWPRLFVNRDYVFNRRYLVDNDSKTIIIYSKSTEHPAFPKNPEKYRIEDYWSCMVIKPYTDLQQPGVEFSLTYYDNPGVNIPSSVTTWVAMRAMPDFLGRLRDASKKYRQYCKEVGISESCLVIRKHDKEQEEFEKRNKLEYCSFRHNKNKFKRTSDDGKWPQASQSKGGSNMKLKNDMHNSSTTTSSDNNSPSTTAQSNAANNFWKYFCPTYYFH